MVLNKDSNEVKRFIEAMEGISKILDANSLIYRPILDGHRYITYGGIIKGSQNNQKDTH